MIELLIISLSSIKSDPRVLRQISLFQDSCNVTVVGYSDFENEKIDFIQLQRPVRKKGFFRLVSQLKTLILVLFRRYERYYWSTLDNKAHLELIRESRRFDLILANDFDCAPLALTLESKRYVLDAHEYTPNENYSSIASHIFSGYKNWLCEFHISKFDKIFTVSDGISQRYALRYKAPKPDLLFNTPSYELLLPSKVSDQNIRLVHHGIAVKGRGIENIVHLMALLPPNFSLTFFLVPADQSFYSELVSLSKENGRISFRSPVPTVEIAKTINEFDIGIFLAPPLSVNHLNTLPNKFFEFVQARLMVAVSPAPEMEKIINEHDFGIVFDSFNLDVIANRLISITTEEIAYFKSRSDIAARELCWEKQNKELKNYVLKI